MPHSVSCPFSLSSINYNVFISHCLFRTNLLKQFYLSRRKRLARYNAAAAAIREDGENFDALEFVKSRIAIAKKGGFKHDIWRSPDDQPETPWLKYEMPDKKK